MKDILTLLRVRQYYKNAIVFLPLLFSGNLLDLRLFLLTLLGFFILCAISSGNYVINDILDRKNDRLNKEKAERPIAKGSIGVGFAWGLASALILAGLVSAYALSPSFSAFCLFLSILSMIYSLWLRDEVFLDVIVISVNFVIRAVSGAVLIGVMPSPWLILCPFFLALLIAVGKRRSEAETLGGSGGSHRKVLLSYTPVTTGSLLNISASLFIMSYSMYSFLSAQKPYLLATIPVMLYSVFRFRFLVENGSDIARHPERLVTDARSLISGCVWVGMVVLILYFTS